MKELRPLISCCSFLGVLPFYEKIRCPPYFTTKIYLVTLAIAVSGLYCFIVYEKLLVGKFDLDLYFIFEFIGCILVLRVIGASTINSWDIFESLEGLQSSLRAQLNTKLCGIPLLPVKFSIYCTVLVLMVAILIWNYIHGKASYLHLTFYIITFIYIAGTYGLQIVILQLTINGVKALRKALIDTTNFRDFERKLYSFIKLHCILRSIVHHYNSYFGWIMLLQILHCGTNIMAQIHFCLKYLQQTPLHSVVVSVTLCAYISAFFIIHTMKAEALKMEFTSFANLGDRLLSIYIDANQPISSLSPFIEQINRIPLINAAGFFPVDYCMIVTLFGIYSAFVILIVQSVSSQF